MHPVIYDVAVSIDGYISGPGGDISRFAHSGPVVDDYLSRLATYDTAIMGRATYEFGYDFGLKPGQNPYPAMKTHVFSATLDLPADKAVQVERDPAADRLRQIRNAAEGPIYLCGGGAFAGVLLSLGLIDRLRLKRAPVVLGGGVPLFAGGATPESMTLISTVEYASGYLFQEFAIP